MLPRDMFDLIAIFSGQANVFHTLKHQLTPQVYDAYVDDWDYVQIYRSLKFFHFIEVTFYQRNQIVYLSPSAEYLIKHFLKKEVEKLE